MKILKKSFAALLAVTMLFAGIGVFAANDQPVAVQPGPIEPGILGSYFDAPNLEPSSLRMMYLEKWINFSWGYRPPDILLEVIEPTTYSARWTGYLKPEKTGTYTIKTLSDDGVRVTLGGQLLIDRWGLLNMQYTASRPVYLEAGKYYPINMEYQQLPLHASCALFWESDVSKMELVPFSVFWTDKEQADINDTWQYYNLLDATGTGLLNEFQTVGLAGNTTVGSEVKQIYYDWKFDAPAGIKDDTFAMRSTGLLEAKYTGPLTLTFEVDDAVRVWVDGKLLLDAWGPHSREDVSLTFDAVVGQKYPIVIEYADLGGGATVIMYWSSEAQELEVVPTKYLYSK